MNHSKYKVFLVDDDKEDLQLLTEAFKIADCASTIEWFISPLQLLIHLKRITPQSIPDIIIMDHQMPLLLDGRDLVEYLRTDRNLQFTTLAVY
ncbi:MAG TPA: response regulator, partial [Ferruginibacter sp.]|nr:response regulator [Ferruginibacter sp.]